MWCALSCACSAGSGGPDGGAPDSGFDGGGDPGPVVCQDPGVYCLIVEPGVQACTVFEDGRTWQQELAVKGRLSLVPQEVRLDPAQVSQEVALVSKLEFGPDAQVLTPAGPGRFTPSWGSILEPPDSGYQYFDYRQDFEVAGGPLAITLQAYYWVERGVPEWRGARLIPSARNGLIFRGLIGTDEYDLTKRQTYDSCDFGMYTLFLITAEVSGGDRVVLHKRKYTPDAVAGSMPANLEWAEVTLGGSTRQVSDPFALVYSADHHNFNERFAVALDPPIGEVAIVVLPGDQAAGHPTELIELDASQNELRRHTLTAYQEQRQ